MGSFGITGETLAEVNGCNPSNQSRAGLICTQGGREGSRATPVTNTVGLAKLCDAELVPALQ